MPSTRPDIEALFATAAPDVSSRPATDNDAKQTGQPPTAAHKISGWTAETFAAMGMHSDAGLADPDKQVKADVVEVTFSDGTQLAGTPDMRIFTGDNRSVRLNMLSDSGYGHRQVQVFRPGGQPGGYNKLTVQKVTRKRAKIVPCSSSADTYTIHADNHTLKVCNPKRDVPPKKVGREESLLMALLSVPGCLVVFISVVLSLETGNYLWGIGLAFPAILVGADLHLRARRISTHAVPEYMAAGGPSKPTQPPRAADGTWTTTKASHRAETHPAPTTEGRTPTSERPAITMEGAQKIFGEVMAEFYEYDTDLLLRWEFPLVRDVTYGPAQDFWDAHADTVRWENDPARYVESVKTLQERWERLREKGRAVGNARIPAKFKEDVEDAIALLRKGLDYAATDAERRNYVRKALIVAQDAIQAEALAPPPEAALDELGLGDLKQLTAGSPCAAQSLVGDKTDGTGNVGRLAETSVKDTMDAMKTEETS